MITQLCAQNVKKLEAVQIRPDGKPVILTGDNEAGKSTVLDCIWMAITGNVPAQPIRDGQQKASITLEITIDDEQTDIVVERTFTSKGSYISVKDKDGKKLRSPQKILDGLFSSLTLDPLEFSRMKPKDQRETLLRIAGIDLTQWDTRYKELYGLRTDANRILNERKAAHKSLQPVPAGTPAQETSANALIQEIQAMKDQQTARENAETALAKDKSDLLTAKDKIKELQEALKNWQDREKALSARIESTTLPDAPSQEAIAQKHSELERIEDTNKNVRAKLNFDASMDAVNRADNVAKKAQQAIDEHLKTKQQLLEKADFGIEGLFVNDDGVIFEGQPLEQQSTARTMEISARIAMRDTSKLKLLIIRDASLIGTKIFQRIAELAEEHGFQLWVERFQEIPGERGIHIVDGTIAYIDGQPVEPTAEEEETPEPSQTSLLDDEEIDF